jgi:ubiquinone/menaquinone biosynthesis C-methylase UbiE
VTEWYEEWFGEDYLRLYPHRDDADAQRAVALIADTVGLQSGWNVLDVGCGGGRHTRAFAERGVHCVGLDLSATLLHLARQVTSAPLVRADMRQLPIRPASIDLTVNLFTSFGYFDRDAEHSAALAEMIGTLKLRGWFVIDFLNPAAVLQRLVPQETLVVGGDTVEVTRSVSADGRFVCKSIRVPRGKQYTERVRLFEPGQIRAMLEALGVSVTHSFGDYDASAPTPGSPRTIIMGQAG